MLYTIPMVELFFAQFQLISACNFLVNHKSAASLVSLVFVVIYCVLYCVVWLSRLRIFRISCTGANLTVVWIDLSLNVVMLAIVLTVGIWGHLSEWDGAVVPFLITTSVIM